jgi:hypothetical protein
VQRIIHFLWRREWGSSVRDSFFFVCKRIIPAARIVEFIRDRLSYVILRGCWCITVVLNVHAPWEDKNDDDVTDIFYEELVQDLVRFVGTI